MALTIPLAEEAIVHILRNPDTVIGVAHPDTNRRQAAIDLAAIPYSVHIGRTPQTSSTLRAQMAVTIQRLPGFHATNVDSFPVAEWPIFDITTWAKTDGNRVNLETLLRFGQLLRILLVGLKGTIQGVEICTISTETDAFESDETPDDASPDWVSGYVYAYNVIHETSNASHRFAIGV